MSRQQGLLALLTCMHAHQLALLRGMLTQQLQMACLLSHHLWGPRQHSSGSRGWVPLWMRTAVVVLTGQGLLARLCRCLSQIAVAVSAAAQHQGALSCGQRGRGRSWVVVVRHQAPLRQQRQQQHCSASATKG